MSTKINARSPFFISYTEPVKPLVELVCSSTTNGINATDFAVGVQGNITLPGTDYGSFISITSSNSDYANGKWAVVATPTVRSMVLRTLVPPGFSNAGDYVDCTVTADQVVADCLNKITLDTPITDKTLAVFGNSTTITLSDNFSISAGTLAYKFGQNSYSEFDLSLSSGVVTITTKTTAGVFPIVIVAYSSSDSTTCEVVDSFNVTVNNAGEFICDTADLLGGNVSPDGVLTLPNSAANSVITKTMETSGGSAVESVAANGTGSSITKRLYYEITVPTGYSNAAASIECYIDYTQASNIVVPTLICGIIDFDDQYISQAGAVFAGTLEDHYSFSSGSLDLTDFNFSPKSYTEVENDTDRNVTYSITVPSGYTNAGDILSCDYEIKQPGNPSLTVCSSRNDSFWIGTRTPLETNYLTNYTYTTGNLGLLNVFTDVSSIYQLQGKKLCSSSDGGITKSPFLPANGNITVIGKINYGSGGVSTVTVPEEFWIQFGSGGLITTMHRKNYANQTTTQIF